MTLKFYRIADNNDIESVELLRMDSQVSKDSSSLRHQQSTLGNLEKIDNGEYTPAQKGEMSADSLENDKGFPSMNKEPILGELEDSFDHALGQIQKQVFLSLINLILIFLAL